MKNSKKLLGLTVIFLITIIYIFQGCDTGGDSVATGISPPSLLTPADRDSMISLTPTFTWSGNATTIQIAVNTDFTTLVNSSSSLSGNSYTMPSGLLSANTFYYWRAGQSSSGTIYWSANTFTFKTGTH
jgi:hypothetical protein